MSSLPALVEVSPRDGLQNEPQVLGTAFKVELVERCVEAGMRRIEAVSFVHPDAVPQMADAEGVMDAVTRDADVSYAGLVLNERGLARAIDAGMDEINYVVVATDTFGIKNQGMTTEQALARWRVILPAARDAGLATTVTIGAAFGCPFEGEVGSARIRQILQGLVGHEPDEVALADTIGAGDPGDVGRKLRLLREELPTVRTRCHFHNTRNTGLANVYAAVTSEVDALDASLGGIGGCPFAPAATGNVPTEDVWYLLDRLGVRTGLDVGALLSSVSWLEGHLGTEAPGMLARAGVFPPSGRR